MSGIFGIIRTLGAPVADAELAHIADTLKHRGPDGIRYSANDKAGLGHCMLHSTPESLHETLPFRDEPSGLTITADARIDNREQLMADIPVRYISGQVVGDSHLILRAYMKWGEACVDHLLGDFAFAIWDERAQSLFVARDHMGCKPFYYHCHDGLFVFASSAMAVARVPAVRATLNEGRVADYLVQELEGINKTCSWYNEISRMPPAHCGHYRGNRFQIRQYWTLEPADITHLKTDEDYLEAFTEIYTEAVRARLRCQTEPASMLSGGLDSSTIVALARDLLVADGKPSLRTYSGISEEGESCPETRSIEAIVGQGNLTSKCLRPSDTDNYTEGLATALEAMEDPFDGDWTLLALMFLTTAQDGGRILLSGLDGEHAVGAPTNYITYLLRQSQWRTAWKEAQGFSRHYWRGHNSAPRLYLQAVRSRLASQAIRGLNRKLGAPRRYRCLLREHDIAAGFARRVHLPARVREYDHSRLQNPQVSLQAWHRATTQMPYLTAAIERYGRLASYFGVEARHPLMDLRLLRLSIALPWWWKVQNGWSKFMLRLVANERLPHSVAWREGWEELGWMFTARQALPCVAGPAFPLEAMNESLSAYLNSQCLQRCQRGCIGGDVTQLMNSLHYYQLYQWLQRHGSVALKKEC
jgi:asparagine synthase (glutamine-hydrolysing)